METARLIPNQNAYTRPGPGVIGTLFGPYPLRTGPNFKQEGYPDSVQMNKEPQRVICPTCKIEQTTVISKKSGKAVNILAQFMIIAILWYTWLWALPIILVPIALVPYCIKRFYDTLHHCPVCNKLIGKRQFAF
ncbi:Lipopolysaccharide-induced tumor necrosis factor-alpha factor-like [Oopsacas minuta]|uniref:Lipopolysaccharide-induced tumor necrosis factor-alpha factor-like n=1 Tax=Oopsacas minuta TaxID=111878 RepID=A0AAV7JW90_9METZ|nr:Lipopolysaccharide-induced tumor necrosis factor-alpha factor-like [Oopsacas minuta]